MIVTVELDVIVMLNARRVIFFIYILARLAASGHSPSTPTSHPLSRCHINGDRIYHDSLNLMFDGWSENINCV